MLRTAVALIIFTGYTIPAIADTDYRCLTQCVNGGRPSTVCLKECSYNNTPLPTSSPSSIGTGQERLEYSHKQFAAPVPVSNGVILPPVQTNHTAPDKDYVCVAKCQQEGMQYQFCEEKCAKKTQAGSILPATSHPDTP